MITNTKYKDFKSGRIFKSDNITNCVKLNLVSLYFLAKYFPLMVYLRWHVSPGTYEFENLLGHCFVSLSKTLFPACSTRLKCINEF